MEAAVVAKQRRLGERIARHVAHIGKWYVTATGTRLIPAPVWRVRSSWRRRRQRRRPTLLAWPSAAARSASRRLPAAIQGRWAAVMGWRRPSEPAVALPSLGARAACMLASAGPDATWWRGLISKLWPRRRLMHSF